MKLYVIVLLTFLLTQVGIGQKQDVWIQFYDSSTELLGYKDLTGIIKIRPTLENQTRADSFYNIIAAQKKSDNSYKSMYLLKDGREVGQDSVYQFDYSFDCESEGKIIFYDKKKDRVGFFDKNGIAIIPAVYNYVSRFHNGTAVAHKNAKRKCWGEGEDTTTCEHLGWDGGETTLINEQNEVLIDSLTIDVSNFNWYSMRVNDPSVDKGIFVSIRGRHDTIYSFINYEKEFRKWYNNYFLPTVRSKDIAKIQSLLFTEVTYWSKEKGWSALPGHQFLQRLPTAITSQRFQQNELRQTSISRHELNPFMFEKDLYRKFYNACSEDNKEVYPLFSVIVSHYKKRAKQLKSTAAATEKTGRKISNFDKKYEMADQEHFDFLRTEQGYRLLSVSLSDEANDRKINHSVNEPKQR